MFSALVVDMIICISTEIEAGMGLNCVRMEKVSMRLIRYNMMCLDLSRDK